MSCKFCEELIRGIAGGMIVWLDFWGAGFATATPSEVFAIVAIALVTALKASLPVSYATVVRTGAMIDVLTGMVFSVVTDNGTNVSADTGLSM